jgi:zinc D-Ala-D-Ala carboxypeptidase
MEIKHFTLDEFCASTTAMRLKIDNGLPEELEPFAWATLEMLERIRAHLSAKSGKDVSVVISSGYRCPNLNKAVGGSANSDHLLACAADIKAPEFGTPLAVARELSGHVDDLGIGQLINEFPGASGWVHVSTRKPAKTLNRVITITAQGAIVGVREA